jgi:FlaA1/EpsC-like NDP-sugar epimerase
MTAHGSAHTILPRLAATRPTATLVVVDAAAWITALTLAGVAVPGLGAAATVAMAAGALGLQFGLGHLCRLYRRRYVVGSFDEVRVIASVVAGSVAGSVVIGLGAGVGPARATLFAAVAGLTALDLEAGARYVYRLSAQRHRRPRADARPVLVLGAGDAGTSIVQSMLRDPRSPYRPVGLLDDDPRKRNLRISGVPVLGGRQELAAAAHRLGASVALVAIPSADPAVLRDLAREAARAGLRVKVLPPVAQLIDGKVAVSDIRTMDVRDLLGRRQVDIDLDAAANYLTGKRVLVTGAGGSIGSELCRQVHAFAPAELIMLDRDESALHAVQLSIHGRALLDDPETVLADIRDVRQLTRMFEERRPHVVFHAAALKHLPLLEQFPGESVKTNVWGTVAVLRAARAVGVRRFVNLSTDKAADPVSVLGYSKRIAERLTAHAAGEVPGTFVSVRFGNVLASRGSVLETFTAQAAAGGPITVTDPDVTRYFMTIREAAQLVIQAGALSSPDADVLVLDMGEQVRIADVAQRLADSARGAVRIVFTGLRPGEKLHEQLVDPHDEPCAGVHPLISQFRVPRLDPVVALGIDCWADPAAVREALRRLARGTESGADWAGVKRAGVNRAGVDARLRDVVAGLEGRP